MPTISFKVTADEARAIRRRARAENSTISDYLRKSAVPVAPKKTRRLVIKKHPVSGLPYDASATNLPVVTLEQMSDALADFP